MTDRPVDRPVVVAIFATGKLIDGIPGALVRLDDDTRVIDRMIGQLTSLGVEHIVIYVDRPDEFNWDEDHLREIEQLPYSVIVMNTANEAANFLSLANHTHNVYNPQKIVVLMGSWVMTDELVEEVMGYGSPTLFSFRDGSHGFVLSEGSTKVITRMSVWAIDMQTIAEIVWRGEGGHVLRKNLGFSYAMHPEYNGVKFLDASDASDAAVRKLAKLVGIKAHPKVMQPKVTRRRDANRNVNRDDKVAVIEADTQITHDPLPPPRSGCC